MTKKKLRYYLAHPIIKRQYIREQELIFEKNTRIVLINPFYDGYERIDVVEIDKGLKKEWDTSLDYKRIVETDLSSIDSTKGIIAYVERGIFSIGTSMEIWYAYTHKKVIYIVTPNCDTHPWLKYVVDKTNGKIVKSFKELEEVFK